MKKRMTRGFYVCIILAAISFMSVFSSCQMPSAGTPVIEPPTEPVEPADTTSFITTWQTSSAEENITIPTNSSYTYNYSVDWGDGTVEADLTGDAVHSYSSTGTHRIRISGDFPAICFNGSGDYRKIKSIEQWGDISWKSVCASFYGCYSLVINASDAPDLSEITDMSSMFRNCSSMNSDLNNWDVSNVEIFDNVFSGARAFNGDISDWDVSKGTNFYYMFGDANEFNGDISSWDVSSAENMGNMFYHADAFNADISGWDVSEVVNMNSTFLLASSFNSNLKDWNVSQVTEMEKMFSGARAFNGDIEGWDVSGVTDMEQMLRNTEAFTGHDLSGWVVSQVTSHNTFSDGWGSNNTEPSWP